MLLAEDVNELAAMIARLERAAARAESLAAQIAGMPTILRARVEAVHGAEPGGTGRAAGITYDLRPLGGGDESVVRDLAPLIGRSAEGDTRIRAAAIGDPCLLLRFPDGAGAFENVLCLGEPTVFLVCP